MNTVQDILNRKGSRVVVVSPETTVFAAAALMKAETIGSLIIVDGSGEPVGMFTERDVLRRVVAEGRDPTVTTVRDVMSSPVSCCKPATTLSECQSVMTHKRHRHLPVVDGNRLVGVISSGDILALEKEVQQTTIEYLHEYLHGRR